MWDISGDKLIMINSGFSYNIRDLPEQKRGFNPNHFDLYSANAKLNDYSINGYSQKAKIEHFSLLEKHGFTLEDFNVEVISTNGLFELKGLDIKTNNTSIHTELKTIFNPFFIDLHDKDTIKIEFQSDFVNLNDLYYFYPELDSLKFISKTIHRNPLKISFALEGDNSNFNINEFELTGLDSTSIVFSGTILNSLNPDSASASLYPLKIVTNKKDIGLFLNNNKSINLDLVPLYLGIDGQLNTGSLENFFNGSIQSNYGTINIDEFYESDNKNPEILLSLSADLHQLKKTNTLGINALSCELLLSYSGDDYYHSTIAFDFHLDSLDIQEYN
jgi:hypothetical protein